MATSEYIFLLKKYVVFHLWFWHSNREGVMGPRKGRGGGGGEEMEECLTLLLVGQAICSGFQGAWINLPLPFFLSPHETDPTWTILAISPEPSSILSNLSHFLVLEQFHVSLPLY